MPYSQRSHDIIINCSGEIRFVLYEKHENKVDQFFIEFNLHVFVFVWNISIVEKNCLYNLVEISGDVFMDDAYTFISI